MRDRTKFLEDACDAMMAGDARACETALDRFRRSALQQPLDEAEETACARQLERLRTLAVAACDGIEAARSWLTDLVQATGGLDVYDRGGRQRVSTELGPAAHRF